MLFEKLTKRTYVFTTGLTTIQKSIFSSENHSMKMRERVRERERERRKNLFLKLLYFLCLLLSPYHHGSFHPLYRGYKTFKYFRLIIEAGNQPTNIYFSLSPSPTHTHTHSLSLFLSLYLSLSFEQKWTQSLANMKSIIICQHEPGM